MIGVGRLVGGGDGLGVRKWWLAFGGEVEEGKRGAWRAYICGVYAEGRVAMVAREGVGGSGMAIVGGVCVGVCNLLLFATSVAQERIGLDVVFEDGAVGVVVVDDGVVDDECVELRRDGGDGGVEFLVVCDGVAVAACNVFAIVVFGVARERRGLDVVFEDGTRDVVAVDREGRRLVTVSEDEALGIGVVGGGGGRR